MKLRLFTLGYTKNVREKFATFNELMRQEFVRGSEYSIEDLKYLVKALWSGYEIK
jgi:hypothetical protein